MQGQTPRERAAHNNARLCDAVCRSHGAPGEFHPTLWLDRHETPPYYPNVVTLSETASVGELLEAIRLLDAGELGDGWGVKDSFSALDLGSCGFRLLFHGQWLHRAAGLSEPGSPIAGVSWHRIETPRDLRTWESAWTEASGSPTPARPQPIFRSGLLQDPDVTIFGARRGRTIVAGFVANRSGADLGLSNFFAPAAVHEDFRASGVSAAMEAFPGSTLVGYEVGAEVSVAGRLGFEPIGALRVWVKAT